MPNLKPDMHLSVKSEFSFLLFVDNLLKNLRTEEINWENAFEQKKK